jgi:hypothetical protein
MQHVGIHEFRKKETKRSVWQLQKSSYRYVLMLMKNGIFGKETDNVLQKNNQDSLSFSLSNVEEGGGGGGGDLPPESRKQQTSPNNSCWARGLHRSLPQRSYCADICSWWKQEAEEGVG